MMDSKELVTWLEARDELTVVKSNVGRFVVMVRGVDGLVHTAEAPTLREAVMLMIEELL